MNKFVLILLWQHILHLCTLFLVQGGKLRTISAFVGFVIITVIEVHTFSHTDSKSRSDDTVQY